MSTDVGRSVLFTVPQHLYPAKSPRLAAAMRYPTKSPSFQEETSVSSKPFIINPRLSLSVPKDANRLPPSAAAAAAAASPPSSASTNSNPPHASHRRSQQPSSRSFQQQLRDHCLVAGLPSPVYHDIVDVQCGQTAFTSAVTIQGMTVQASSWYGSYAHLDHARGDAAEAALRRLGMRSKRRSYIMA